MLAKLKSQERRYRVYKVGKDGQVVDDGFGVIEGYKPVFAIGEKMLLVKKEREVAIWRAGSGVSE